MFETERAEVTWSSYLPDGLLADVLAGQVGKGSRFERLERIGGWERLIAWAQAQQAREIAGFIAVAEGEESEQAMQSAVAEVGLMVRVSPRAADARVSHALTLAERLPATLAALGRGDISLPSSRAIAEETANLPAAEAATVEQQVLRRAAAQTPGRILAATRRAVLNADPDAVRRRHERARRERGVWVQDEPDGMAGLYARLSAPDAISVQSVLDEYARRSSGPDDTCTIDERRADALVDLICGKGIERRVHVDVRVTVPLSVLLGADDQPGELASYGPIPAEVARDLAAQGTWRRLLTDPVSGALLDYGTTRYTPPSHLAGHVTTRDGTCRFPSCRVPAHRCDLDHGEPFKATAGTGPTNPTNLSAKCRAHHRLKHTPGWRATQTPDGAVTWHTPSGHTYHTYPPPLSDPTPARAPVAADMPSGDGAAQS